MDRIAFSYQCLEYFGVLRHVLRYLQWDHGMAAMDVVQGVVDHVDADPARFPLLSFLLTHGEDFLLPPAGWAPLLDEARRLLVEQLGVTDDSGLDTAFSVTLHLLPWPGRELPCTVELQHDYLAYFRSATASLVETGASGVPGRPLINHGPGRIHVAGDPDDVSGLALGRQQAPGADEYPGFRKSFWVATHLELLSELTVYHPMSPQFLEQARQYFDLDPAQPTDPGLDDVPLTQFADGSVPVSLVRWQPREPARVD